MSVTDDAGHQSTTSVTIYLIDINDNPPIFLQDSYHFSVSEATEVGQLAFSLSAIDLDGTAHHNTISRYFMQGLDLSELHQLPFELREDGTVYLTRELDYETHHYQLLLSCCSS